MRTSSSKEAKHGGAGSPGAKARAKACSYMCVAACHSTVDSTVRPSCGASRSMLAEAPTLAPVLGLIRGNRPSRARACGAGGEVTDGSIASAM